LRNRLENVARARLLRQHGYSVLLYDARGCGESGGDMISYGLLETRDLLGALDYLRGRGFRNFGVLGFSQGGITIALAAAKLRDLDWAVLECTPGDLMATFDHDCRAKLGLPGWLVGALVLPVMEWRLGVSIGNQREPRDCVADLHCPLYVMAGGRDDRVLPSEAKALFNNANQPKWFWFLPLVPHTNYYPILGKSYEVHLLYFLKLAEEEDAGKSLGSG